MRSQLGLLRRGRLMSNGQGGGNVPPPDPDPDPEPDNDPDDAEALVAVLGELVTHATFDAWVQDHEAFLPERPDNWTTMNLASKRAWVVANYDFNAVEPDAEGVADDTAGAEDGADETGADEGTGNAADEADNTDD